MSRNIQLTRLLLISGAFAGPIYITGGLIQIITRPGFDMTRHPLSMLSLGDFGWIQIANFILTGTLVISGAIGLRRAAEGDGGWRRGALFIGLYGLGVLGGGLFSTDPSLGFPPGTPNAYPTTMTWHALLHFIFGQAGFLCIIIGTFIFARYFAITNQRGWMTYSVFTGGSFLVGIGVGIVFMGTAWTMIMLYVTVALVWVWLTMLMAYCLRQKLSIATGSRIRETAPAHVDY